MKRLIAILIILVLLSGCNTGEPNMKKIKYDSGIYDNKNWSDPVGTYTEAVIADKETAIHIATAILQSMQNKGYARNYVAQSVFFDEADEIWIVSFWENKSEDTLGSDCSIALKKSDAKVMRIWFGE